MGSSVRDGVLHVVRFEQSRDGDDESCTCSLAFGLDVLSMMELCDEIFYKLKWLSWPCTCQITSPT